MLHFFRALFILLCGLIGAFIGGKYNEPAYYGGGIGAATGFALMLVEWGFSKRFIGIISTVMFGVVFGFVISYLFYEALSLLKFIQDLSPDEKSSLQFSITFLMCFISVIAIIHTKDDFKIVIPFIDLSREGVSNKPLILDTSAIIDGRIADICKTKIVDSPIIIPKFVLEELQNIADSPDKNKRIRGRRGLDILAKMREDKTLVIEVNEATLPGVDGVDAKLVRLSKSLSGRLITTDFNLTKVARVQDVEVINVNDLSNALRPVVLQGEHLTVKIIKLGEAQGQGVGYLDDGTMVVGDNCANKVGDRVELLVTNVLQTSAGRMIFGRTD